MRKILEFASPSTEPTNAIGRLKAELPDCIEAARKEGAEAANVWLETSTLNELSVLARRSDDDPLDDWGEGALAEATQDGHVIDIAEAHDAYRVGFRVRARKVFNLIRVEAAEKAMAS